MRGGPANGIPALDLTDDQRAQLRKIREARQSEFKAAGEKLHTAREGMRALMEADSINESAIRSKSQEVAAAEAEVAILNAKVRAESLQILTSEQQAKLKELRSQPPGPDEAAATPARAALTNRIQDAISASLDSISILPRRSCRSSCLRCVRADRCRPSNNDALRKIVFGIFEHDASARDLLHRKRRRR